MVDHQGTWDYLTVGDASTEHLHSIMSHVVQGLSGMVGQEFKYMLTSLSTRDIADLTECTGHPESETVGVYLRMHGALNGQAILIMGMVDAMNLVDLLMGNPLGTSSSLGIMQRSALAEIGNLVVAYFLNAVARLTDSRELLRPTPPAVVVDMIAVVLELLLSAKPDLGDQILVLEMHLQDLDEKVNICFWVVPD